MLKHCLYLGVYAFPSLIVLLSTTTVSGQLSSKIVYYQDGALRGVADANDNYIPDFSYAGYHYGEDALPELPVRMTIGPVEGDDTEHIQRAINSMADLPPDASGHRGALLLEPGAYQIEGQLQLNVDGVVLRGSGRGRNEATNTILTGVGNTPHQRDLIVIGGESDAHWTNEVPGSSTEVVSRFLPAGSRSVEVASTSGFAVGDEVIFQLNHTTDWLRTINFGGTHGEPKWNAGVADLIYNRVVVGVDYQESKLILDAPIYDHYESFLTRGRIYKWDDTGIHRELGIENLRVVIATNGALDENHAWTCIRVQGVKDAWVRSVTGLNFGFAMVSTHVASQVTVYDCEAYKPSSLVRGGRRYNFNADGYSNNILFLSNRARFGRHTYVVNGRAQASGIVFHDCHSSHNLLASEGHHRWSAGLLYDNVTFEKNKWRIAIGLYNRGSYGTGHGWSSVHSVAWAVDAGEAGVIVQQPPERQNYAIGCRGQVSGQGVFDHSPGYIELSNRPLSIPSLYQAQLRERLERGPRPDMPAKLSGFCDGRELTLSWQDVAADESGYVVYRYDALSKNEMALETLPANATEHVIADTKRGEMYRVAAVSESGYSSFTPYYTVEQNEGIRHADAREFSVSPNPVGATFRINSDQSFTQLEVISASGRLYRSIDVTRSIDASDWPSGLYVVKAVSSCGESFTCKMLKQ